MPLDLWAAKGRGMIDEYKKFIGVLILVIAAAVSVFVMKTYYPEFYDQIDSADDWRGY